MRKHLAQTQHATHSKKQGHQRRNSPPIDLAGLGISRHQRRPYSRRSPLTKKKLPPIASRKHETGSLLDLRKSQRQRSSRKDYFKIDCDMFTKLTKHLTDEEKRIHLERPNLSVMAFINNAFKDANSFSTYALLRSKLQEIKLNINLENNETQKLLLLNNTEDVLNNFTRLICCPTYTNDPLANTILYFKEFTSSEKRKLGLEYLREQEQRRVAIEGDDEELPPYPANSGDYDSPEFV